MKKRKIDNIGRTVLVSFCFVMVALSGILVARAVNIQTITPDEFRAVIMAENNISAEGDELVYGADEAVAGELREEISLMPDFIIDILESEEWKVIVVENPGTYLSDNLDSEIIEKKDIYKDTLVCDGFTSYNYKTIFIRERKDIEKIKDVLYHEIGHVVDKEIYSSTEEWKELYIIYNKEGYTGYRENRELQYATTNASELFATAFKDFYLYPSYLEANAPELYIYINSVVLK